MSKHRKFFITVNNWTDKDYEDCLELHYEAVYSILCKEVGEEKGTPHLHLWVRFKSPRSFTSIAKLIPRGNVQPGKGADKDQVYLKKGGDFLERGVMSDQGKRTDLDWARETIKETGQIRKIVEHVNFQATRTCELILKYHERRRDWIPEVKWYWGESECGKTETAMKECDYEEMWISDKSLRWWEGYDAHPDVILDDFRKDFCTFHELLRILDRYPYRIECKNGSRQLLARRIWITCPFHPADLYETREDLYQLIRRITEIKYFGRENGTEVMEQKSGVIIDPDFKGCPLMKYEMDRMQDDFESYEMNGIRDSE